MPQFLGMALTALDKLLIRAPRPYFVDSGLLSSSCKVAEFGSPSGHSLLASTCYPMVGALLLRYFKATRKTSILTYTFIVAPILVYTGLSRLYEGMHSIDQVLSGIV